MTTKMHRAVASSSDCPTDIRLRDCLLGVINLGSSVLGAAGTLWRTATPVKQQELIHVEDDRHRAVVHKGQLHPRSEHPGLRHALLKAAPRRR